MPNAADTSNNGLSDRTAWRPALLYAVPITTLVLSLFFYWFAIANRYVVFLYHHDMGPLVPDTSPFGRVTSSRYWMTGLVASGLVMAVYGSLNFLLGRLARKYHPPAWWRVWVLSALPLAIGIPLITMSQNRPVLPWNLALVITLVALIGLALALFAGRTAAREPGEFILLAIDGFGLMWVLLSLVGLERLQSWLERGSTQYVWGLFAGVSIRLF
jgi:hypothetical protein